MAALDAFRRQELLNPPPTSSAPARRATVGSPPPFIFSNTFESPRPHSRNEGYSYGRPYPYRRCTISGHSQGHNVNDAPQLTPYADTSTVMWSDSASPSPIMSNTVVLPGTESLPSSPSGSPKLIQPSFEYKHLPFAQSLHSPMNTSFNSLNPSSPDYHSSFTHPRSIPPAPSLNTFDSSHISPAASPAASTTSFTIPEITNHSNPPSPGHTSIDHLSSQSLVDEITHLRGRVRDLEFINDLVRIRVAELESAADSKSQVHRELGLGLELASDDSGPSSYPASTSDSARNSITPGFDFLNRDLGPPPADWHLRTQARLKRFCALNRAGNALCAWHDSRRERRAFPPRMAPPQTLNCGCTYSEALFEESLARNGVGAFYPGENVRMDPALRNPLLKLLEERYGYRDGDFERTPEGRWRENEDGLSWEHKASHSGGPRRRDR